MEIVTAIVSKVGEYLVEPSINQTRYLFHFNKIVENLLEAERNLKSKKDDVEKEIEAAERNDERIKATVQDWLSDSRKIMGEVEKLKGKIEVNKTCLNGWCPNWVSRHQLGRKATKTSIRLKKVSVDGGLFDRVGNLAPLSGEPSVPEDFDSFRPTTDAFDKIMEALKNDGIHMVILYGMGGVGKTTLAKAVSKKVKEEGIFKEVVMATVSQTPNFINIQANLAELLNLDLTEKTEAGRAERLLSRFSDSNNNLIILDDIWEEFNFKEKIGVPLSKGCKILLTTRYRNVYTYKEYQSLIPLNVLEEDEGVTLLKRQAGIDDDSVNLNTWATKIAKECGGLPLALVTIGSHLRGKKDTETWEFVCEKVKKSKLEDISHVNSTQSGVYAILKLSYDYLKTDEIKFCFLMCSLFPEDFKIPLEDLVRIGVGLDLYKGVSSIEEARRGLCSMVKTLKDLGLLLDAYEKEFVRMHDIFRDVCLWITSEGENVFMSKIGRDLTQLSREKGWKQYTAISLLENKLKELSVRLVCPKLKILLLGGEKQRFSFSKQLKVSDECFQEMKALEVVSLRYADLSLKSLQFLTNVKTLELSDCELRDISFLAKLNKLEILSFRGSRFEELPIELSGLKELRMLDLRGCNQLKRIPSNLIRSFSQLEELYIEDIFEERQVEERSIETGNARLSEVNDLPRLAVLYLKINSKCLPKDFAFSKLSRYQIHVNKSIHGYLESSKALKIADIDATLLTALFKALYHSVEHLSLERVTGCQNILPSIDQKGLKKLNTLWVSDCEDLKCMIDASQVVEENSELHPSLAKLQLELLPELQCIWKGPMSIHIVNFRSLMDVYVGGCKSLAYLFTLSIVRSLRQLKSLRVIDCESLEFLIKIEEGDNGRGEKMFSKLEDLQISNCKRLEYVFPVFVAAGLIQLTDLDIYGATELKQVFHGKEENEVAEERKDIKLPNLKKLKLYYLEKLTRFFPKNNHSTLPTLEEFQMKGCPNLTIKEGDLEENLQVVKMSNYSSQSWDGIFSGLRCGFFKKIKELSMEDCGVLEHELSFSNLKNLTSLTITHFNKLKHIFSPTVARNHMLQLKTLCIRECAELEQIIDVKDGEEVGANLLQTLLYIEVEKCHKLKNLFPISIARGFQQLTWLQVIDNSELEQIIDVKDGEEVGANLLQTLSKIRVEKCHKLKNLFLISIARGFQQLEVLKVIDNSELEQIIDVKDGEEVGANLLQTLSWIEVERCHKLKILFPISIARGFQQLKRLQVIDNSELEQIIDVKDGEEVGSDLLQTLSLLEWKSAIN
ncbi:disease resistance protein At4g27190-like isoform X2 [Pistacia vera]|uniref:disease resistance protein At4g27190-like isoform X2 n=1 Tax=Pistacia vera TaxID=55513 RepID=UPI0012639987|nr:disease resistance protein At4g27190-like isoform X2 [Pistacia vera]